MTIGTSTHPLHDRVTALPPHQQTAVYAFLEYLEWKSRLPGTGYGEDNRALGERLRAVRLELRQSEDDAAEVAGVALATYQRYEKGTIGRWATQKYLRYAEAWNVSVDWLSDGRGTMFRGNKRPDIAPSTVPAPEAKPSPVRRGVSQARQQRAAEAFAASQNVVVFSAWKGGPK